MGMIERHYVRKGHGVECGGCGSQIDYRLRYVTELAVAPRTNLRVSTSVRSCQTNRATRVGSMSRREPPSVQPILRCAPVDGRRKPGWKRAAEIWVKTEKSAPFYRERNGDIVQMFPVSSARAIAIRPPPAAQPPHEVPGW